MSWRKEEQEGGRVHDGGAERRDRSRRGEQFPQRPPPAVAGAAAGEDEA